MTSTGSQSTTGTTPRRVGPGRATRDPAGDAAPSGQGDAEPGHRREAGHEHITEEELPRTGQVCALAPVEAPTPGDNLD
ncbi:MAG: hypothetical protein ACRDRV_20405 [Pseudonocardiaceae bacterium]